MIGCMYALKPKCVDTDYREQGRVNGGRKAAFKRLGRRGDRARTSRDLPSVPLDTRQETEAGIATGKLRCLEYTGSLENSEILPLPRQKQAEKLLQ
jgi:hypothetical protein